MFLILVNLYNVDLNKLIIIKLCSFPPKGNLKKGTLIPSSWWGFKGGQQLSLMMPRNGSLSAGCRLIVAEINNLNDLNTVTGVP